MFAFSPGMTGQKGYSDAERLKYQLYTSLCKSEIWCQSVIILCVKVKKCNNIYLSAGHLCRVTSYGTRSLLLQALSRECVSSIYNVPSYIHLKPTKSSK